MAVSSSFDITSTVDFQEVDNALNQARKEVAQRYDFKGAKAELVVHGTDGRIERKHSYGHDPRDVRG